MDRNTEYRIIPSVGKTIVKLHNRDDNAYRVLAKIIAHNSTSLGFYPTDDFILSDCFTGISKVNKDAGDVYDKEIGKKIAYKKAANKYYKQYTKIFLKALTEIRTVEAAIEHYMDKRNMSYSNIDTVEKIKADRLSGVSPEERYFLE